MRYKVNIFQRLPDRFVRGLGFCLPCASYYTSQVAIFQ
nr:MAG TPA: hypothetical protein [Caudoviricetes sp.]